jgi:hypothetical protein
VILRTGQAAGEIFTGEGDVGRTLLATFVIIALLVQGPGAVAQEPTPEPGPNAAKLLPDAGAFGSDWILDQTVSPGILARYSFEMTPDVFREVAAGIYGGPNGSRIVVVSLLITENRVAIRQSWEDATELLDNVRSRTSTDYERDQALETMDPPPGCVEAKRLEGTENFVLAPVGGTMCALDPDGILIAVVFGDFGEQTGVAAADAVIETVLEP